MIETPKDAAKRLAMPVLSKGFIPQGLYRYTNLTGEPIYWRIRAKHPNGEKWIRPMHANGNGYELGEPSFPAGRKPLYALHRVAKNPDAQVWITEGEQKAEALNKLGLLATTSGGAQSADSTDWTQLRNRNVIIWPDHDLAGRDYAGNVAAVLIGLGCRVSCVQVEQLGLAESGDVIDWLALHPNATAAGIQALPIVAAKTADISRTSTKRNERNSARFRRPLA
jgi:putative DNA primase/helicase